MPICKIRESVRNPPLPSKPLGLCGNTWGDRLTGVGNGSMWQAFTNLIQGALTYGDLGPDQEIRRKTNRRLRQSRPELTVDAWVDSFTILSGGSVSAPLLRFLYSHLGDYTGLAMGCIRPSDRLIEDLHMPLVCWFDWPHRLCADFWEHFQIDLGEDFDEAAFQTVGDLVMYLQARLRSMDSLPSS